MYYILIFIKLFLQYVIFFHDLHYSFDISTDVSSFCEYVSVAIGDGVLVNLSVILLPIKLPVTSAVFRIASFVFLKHFQVHM